MKGKCGCVHVNKYANVYIFYTHIVKAQNNTVKLLTLGLGVYQTLSIDHGKIYPRMAPQFEM